MLTFDLTTVRGALKQGYMRTNITKDFMAPEFGEKLMTTKRNINNRRKCETFFLDHLEGPITEQLSAITTQREGGGKCFTCEHLLTPLAIREPDVFTVSNRERAFEYYWQFVCNSNPAQVSNLLQFVTGSNVLLGNRGCRMQDANSWVVHAQ